MGKNSRGGLNRSRSSMKEVEGGGRGLRRISREEEQEEEEELEEEEQEEEDQ